MTVDISKVNFGTILAPEGQAITKVDYGVVMGPLFEEVVSKVNYGVVEGILNTTPVISKVNLGVVLAPAPPGHSFSRTSRLLYLRM